MSMKLRDIAKELRDLLQERVSNSQDATNLLQARFAIRDFDEWEAKAKKFRKGEKTTQS